MALLNFYNGLFNVHKGFSKFSWEKVSTQQMTRWYSLMISYCLTKLASIKKRWQELIIGREGKNTVHTCTMQNKEIH